MLLKDIYNIFEYSVPLRVLHSISLYNTITLLPSVYSLISFYIS